jgi:hypothetical protein
MEYLIYGSEVCPTTGTPHLQCFVYFKNPRSVKGSHKYIPGNIEPIKGTPYDNFVYCSKDGKFREFGTRPKGNGKRTDIDTVKELVKSGASRLEIWEASRSFQAMRFAEIGMGLMDNKQRTKPLVKWYWGPTGTGKTETALAEYPDAWMSGKNLKWWLSYAGQQHVILDDFRKDFCTFHELLRILDRYPYNVEVKGGHVALEATVIIITCPYPPDRIYETREDICQLLRRIDKIVPFTKDGTEQGSGGMIDPDQNKNLPIFDPKIINFLLEQETSVPDYFEPDFEDRYY